MRVRDRIVDHPGSLSARLRERRFRTFLGLFGDLPTCRVLDLGGTTEFWRRAPVRPAQVRVVNLADPGEGGPGIEAVLGDACDPAVAEGGFDIAFSNSLVEHLGGYANRLRLAQVIRAAASRHWVQTPYRYFPIEPHFLVPGLQFAPVALRSAVVERWPLTHSRPADQATARESVLRVELIGRAEMSHLFPESRLFFERVGGLPKSLIAVRTRTDGARTR